MTTSTQSRLDVYSRVTAKIIAMPLAAMRIILARTTSKYGNVYLAAR
jgi:hypothetical protein